MKVTTLRSNSGKSIEFVDGIESQPPVIIACTFGPWNTGKTRFGVTLPDTVGLVPVDRKSRRTFEKTVQELHAQGIDRKILMPKEDFIRQINPETVEKMDESASKKFYREHVDKIKEAAWIMHAQKNVSGIMIDLFSQFVQDVRYANYGRAKHVIDIKGKKFQNYMEADQEVIDFINSLASKHLILTCKERSEYVNDVRTDKLSWFAGGFQHLGNHTNLILEHELNPYWRPDADDPTQPAFPNDEMRNWRFGLTVKSSQDRLDLMGQRVLTDDGITFENLATILYPEHDWSNGNG